MILKRTRNLSNNVAKKLSFKRSYIVRIQFCFRNERAEAWKVDHSVKQHIYATLDDAVRLLTFLKVLAVIGA